jgi:8-oxo-dGTP diphosphatase
MAMPQVGPTHSVSVAAAVVDGSGRLLAIRRRDNGRWEPPGGVLELDETIGEGLIREVLEETGLTVEPEALTGVYKNMRRGIVALVFRCRVVDGQVGVSAEAAQVAWLSAEEIAERMDEAYATRLLDALRPGPPAVRAHDGLVLLPT